MEIVMVNLIPLNSVDGMEVTVFNSILITLTAKKLIIQISLVMAIVMVDLITQKSVDGMDMTVPLRSTTCS